MEIYVSFHPSYLAEVSPETDIQDVGDIVATLFPGVPVTVNSVMSKKHEIYILHTITPDNDLSAQAQQMVDVIKKRFNIAVKTA